jgi:HK97 gp10 family phage protein
MTFESKVQIEGLSQLQASLRELPDATAKSVMRRILRSRGQPIADAARATVAKHTGQLAERIQVSGKLSNRQKRQHVKADPSDVEIFVGAPPWSYAHILEYGGENMAAQPYMRPAWDSVKGALLDNLASDLWAEIEKAAKRRGR